MKPNQRRLQVLTPRVEFMQWYPHRTYERREFCTLHNDIPNPLKPGVAPECCEACGKSFDKPTLVLSRRCGHFACFEHPSTDPCRPGLDECPPDYTISAPELVFLYQYEGDSTDDDDVADIYHETKLTIRSGDITFEYDPQLMDVVISQRPNINHFHFRPYNRLRPY